MKYWTCPKCLRKSHSESNIIMKICGSCQVCMEETPYYFESQMEVEE